MSAPTLLIDSALPSLEIAWSADRITELLNKHVLPIARPGQHAEESAIDYVVYTPGKKCLVSCSFRVRGHGPHETQAALVSLAAGDQLRRRRLSPAAIFVPSEHCLVELFPVDWNLPSLPDALSATHMTAVLNDVRDADYVWADPQVLHYRPHRRCVMRYQRSGPVDDGADVFVKVYPPGSKAAEAAAVMAELRPSAAQEGLNIPQPLGVSDAVSSLLMDRARGSSMNEMMRMAGSQREAEAISGLVAGALTTLHSLPRSSDGAPRTLTSEMNRSRRHLDGLRIIVPELGHEVASMFDTISGFLDRFPTELVPVCHGDFTLNQLLCEGEDVSMVDFDRVSAGDPALDVGNLMAKLDRDTMNSNGAIVDDISEKFLEQYQLASGRRNALWERAQLTRAVAFVRSAIRSFRHAPQEFVHSGSDARSFVYLEEARRCLDLL